jgi:PKHD-type hydroxylase
MIWTKGFAMSAPPTGEASNGRRVGASTVTADNVFPRQAIEYLNRLADSRPGDLGSIVRGDATAALAEHVRRSEVFWLEEEPATRPIFQLLAQFAQKANDQIFGLDLVGFGEALQVATYRGADSGFYGWHVDIGAGRLAQRKLSLVVPLTDPTEYEGGELQLFHDHEPATVDMPLGRIVAFPSYVLHRVTPVTKGIRRTLAVWISGPPYR